MTKHLCSSVLTVLFAVLFSTFMAPAVAKQQCSASAGGPGYWSWRMIDGRKCWYEGKPMLSKSALEWPARPAAKPEAEEEVAIALPAKPGNPLDAQARAMESAPPARAIDSDTFEAMWRARIGR